MDKETKDEPPKQPSSSAQIEEKGTEKGEGELSESTPREIKGERAPTVEQSGESEMPTASQSEPKETKKAESTPTSEDSKDTGDSGAKVEPSPAVAASTATTEASSKSGDGGGWGWGGWGRSLWSSVSTVTESAQALGQKVRVPVKLNWAHGHPLPFCVCCAHNSPHFSSGIFCYSKCRGCTGSAQSRGLG